MQSKAIKKINRIGKAGYITTWVLVIIAVLCTAVLSAATVHVRTAEQHGISVLSAGSKTIVSKPDGFLDRVVYHCVTNGNNDRITTSDGYTVTRADLNFKGSAGEGSTFIGIKGDEAETPSNPLTKNNLMAVMVSSVIFSITVILSLFAINRLLHHISKCDTPFSLDVVKKTAIFTASLIPVVISSSVAGTFAANALNPANAPIIYINKTLLAVTVLLLIGVYIFKYGVQLQKESDETL